MRDISNHLKIEVESEFEKPIANWIIIAGCIAMVA
jgi:hypothetical protein